MQVGGKKIYWKHILFLFALVTNMDFLKTVVPSFSYKLMNYLYCAMGFSLWKLGFVSEQDVVFTRNINLVFATPAWSNISRLERWVSVGVYFRLSWITLFIDFLIWLLILERVNGEKSTSQNCICRTVLEKRFGISALQIPEETAKAEREQRRRICILTYVPK